MSIHFRRITTHRAVQPCLATMLLILFLILTSCSSGSLSTSPTPIPTSTAMPTATQVLSSPTPSVLGLAPQHCPAGPRPQFKTFPKGWGGFQEDSKLVGGMSVWAEFDPTYPLRLNQAGTGPKIIWEVGPNFAQTVTVRVTNLSTGDLAGWGDGGVESPTSTEHTLVLDQNSSHYHGVVEAGWQEWGSNLAIFEAGCYSMQASWPGGQWSVNFAAGH